MFQLNQFADTQRALKKFGELFTNYLKEEIKKKQFPYGNPNQKGLGDKVASGKLLDSISYDIEIASDGNPTLVLSYIDYFENVNLGRRKEKKRVPITSILEWIKVRGLRGRNKKGQFIPNLGFAFAIQTNIYKFGIRPSNIYDKGLDGLLDFVDNPPPELADEWQDVFDMIAEDVNKFLEKTINIELPSKIE
jgi:hypothetical protein